MPEGGSDKKITHVDFGKKVRISALEAKRRRTRDEAEKILLSFKTDYLDSLAGRLEQLELMDKRMSEIEQNKQFVGVFETFELLRSEYGDMPRSERIRMRMKLHAKGNTVINNELSPEDEDMCIEYANFRKFWILEIKNLEIARDEWLIKLSWKKHDLGTGQDVEELIARIVSAKAKLKVPMLDTMGRRVDVLTKLKSYIEQVAL